MAASRPSSRSPGRWAAKMKVYIVESRGAEHILWTKEKVFLLNTKACLYIEKKQLEQKDLNIWCQYTYQITEMEVEE